MVNFLDKSDLRRGFKVNLCDLWDRDILKEHQKAIDMFIEGKEVSISLPTGYGKSFM